MAGCRRSTSGSLNWVPGIFWFLLKACFVFFMFAMVKAFVPRYRYDQLMRLGWKVFLPISLAMVVIVAFVLKLTVVRMIVRHPWSSAALEVNDG